MNGDQLHDLHFPDAARNLDFHGIANLLAQQAAADRRGGGNHTVLGIHVFARHQLITDLLVFVEVQHDDGGAQPHAVVRDLGHIDHRKFPQPGVELIQAGVDHALPFLGRVILGVFLQIAVGAGLQDLSGELDAELVFERRDFFLQFLDELFHTASSKL